MHVYRPGVLLIKICDSGVASVFHQHAAQLSTTATSKKSYEVLVVGGGAGGCAVAAKFASKLGPGKVAVIEPDDTHYYQPLFTLVGGGMKTLANAGRPMKKVLPTKAEWLQERCVGFNPAQNTVATERSGDVSYKYLVVALGIQLDYHRIPGLEAALESPGGVCSIYSPLHVNKTLAALQNFQGGNAVFTFPSPPVKCPGAPQKIMYIAEEYLKMHGKRDDATVVYNTSLPVLFGVKKYADALWDVVSSRGIEVNLRRNLVEVKHETKEAVFEHLDNPGQLTTTTYSMLHVCPPQSAPGVLREGPTDLVDPAGFVAVNKHTLQHDVYNNIFAIGDCANTPNAKTAAAAAGQVGVLCSNLSLVMDKKIPTQMYDGYASCPLVTGYSKCILAEFDYDFQPLETFPVNQAVERRSMFIMKKHFMPGLYWHLMLTGRWNGPGMMRKLMHLGMK